MNSRISWKRYSRLLPIVIFSSLMFSTQSHACVGEEAPNELLKRLSDGVISSFNENLDNIRTDPAIATRLIEKILLPHVDFDLASKKVLVFEWGNLTSNQRTRFTHAFKVFLVRHSAVILASYMTNKDKELSEDVFSFEEKIAVEGKIATVKSKMSIDGVVKHEIGYKLHCATTSWKIYDVVIDGVSIIRQYKTQFKYKIDKDGFNGLLAFLNYRNDLMLTLLRN